MKSNCMFYVYSATIILVAITILSALNFPFSWVFYLTVVGQIILVIMVYKVLKDNYHTDKTFDNFYEDNPVNPTENYRS